MSDGIKQAFQPTADTPSFLKDMQDLFAERRFGHIGNWRFSKPQHEGDIVNGIALWDEIQRRAEQGDGHYYFFSDEIQLLEKAFGNIESLLPDNITLIDFGCGPEKSVSGKMGAVIKKIGYKVSRYVPVDLVPENLDEAKAYFEREYPGITVLPFNQDFFKENLPLPKDGLRLSTIFGLTMFNVAIDPRRNGLFRQKIIQMLQTLGSNLRHGEYLSITQDCNPDLDKMKALYEEQRELWLNVLHRVQRDLPVTGNFHPEKFDYEVQWLPNTEVSVRTFIVKNNMKFRLGDERFSLSKGRSFYLHNSFKREPDIFVGFARKAGLNLKRSEDSDSGLMTAHLFQRAP